MKREKKQLILFMCIFSILVSLIFLRGNENLIVLKEEKIKYNEKDLNYLFYNPTSLRVDEQGYLYIVDNMNHRIQVFSENGNFIRTIGRKGQGPGEFLNPTDIYIKGETLYISDTGNRRIQIFSRSGELKKMIKLNFGPMYIVVSKRGEIYVSKLMDEFTQSKEFLIKIISEKGEQLGEFHEAIKTKTFDKVAMDLLNFISIEIDLDDNIVVAHKFLINRVIKYDFRGKFLFEFKTFLKANGPFAKVSKFDLIGFVKWISTDSSGNLYILSYRYLKDKMDFVPGNEIYMYDSSGRYKATLVIPFDAEYIALYRGQNIFALDTEERLRRCTIPKGQ
jgi:hypothetical protein